MVIEILNKMFLVLRKGWLRKKKIKIWLIHYILILSLSLTSPNKFLLLKKSCCCWWKCPLASCTVLDIKPTPCVGGPHSRKHPSLGSGDEGEAQPFVQTTVHSESLSTALFWKQNMLQLGMGSEITALFLPQRAPYLSLSFQKTEYH